MNDSLERRLTLAILGRTAPDAAHEVMGIVQETFNAGLERAVKAVQIELAMCALANDEAPSEWIDGFEFAWNRANAAIRAALAGDSHD